MDGALGSVTVNSSTMSQNPGTESLADTATPIGSRHLTNGFRGITR